MVLVNAQYRVTVTTEYRPPIGDWPVIYQAEELNLDDFYTVRFIYAEPAGGQPFRAAVTAYLASSKEPCAVLEERMLTMILFRTILRIDLNTGTVVQCVDCENSGGLEEIHPIAGGYIIKGEGEIFRYDTDLNQIWQFGGRDIFARPTAEKCFWIEGDVIHCRDWAGWHYVRDLNKNLLSETMEEIPD